MNLPGKKSSSILRWAELAKSETLNVSRSGTDACPGSRHFDRPPVRLPDPHAGFRELPLSRN